MSFYPVLWIYSSYVPLQYFSSSKDDTFSCKPLISYYGTEGFYSLTAMNNRHTVL